MVPQARRCLSFRARQGAACSYRLSNALNRHALDVCVVPLSTVEHRAFSLRPKLRAGDGGLERDSWAKCDQVTTIEKTRAVYPPLGALSRASLERIQQAIKQALELP